MPIDTSIYQNIKPFEAPSLLDSMQRNMTLSQLGMQNQQMQRQMAVQQAMRESYAKNTGADGRLDRQSFLSDIGKIDPQAAMAHQEQFNKFDKDQAESQKSQTEAYQKRASIAASGINHVAQMPQPFQEQAYNTMVKNLTDSGVASPGQFPAYSPEVLNSLTIKAQKHMGQNSADYLGNKKTEADTRLANANADKAISETVKRQPDILGQSDDPAKLVPGLVPKEHQAKAFAEIDAAENTRKMSKAIMDSFDQAVKDTSGIGAVTSYIKDPRSTLALHQAMQPTFKDLEGTVRQAAMDNTFKNVTPIGADTPRDIETKRAALQDYLQSKISAPTARGYGIDLSKFSSTAPYRSAAPEPKTPNGGGGTVSNAYAAPPPIKPGAFEDGYVFMGGDPGDQKSWKRAR